MDIIDKILEEHSVILKQEETVRKVYKVDEDIEIGIHQTKDEIYMYAYSYESDRNLSIKSNFKKLYNGFKVIAQDGYISIDKNYCYTFKLKQEEIIIPEAIKLDSKNQLDLLREQIEKLINENLQLKEENEELKYQLEKCSQIINEHRKLGRKNKFTDEQIEEIKKLRNENMSIRAIAKKFDCSVGLIHKLVK